MKKRNQKLSLHRETLVHLVPVAGRQLERAVGGVETSCGYECGCAGSDEFVTTKAGVLP
jgi:hypothetical protein